LSELSIYFSWQEVKMAEVDRVFTQSFNWFDHSINKAIDLLVDDVVKVAKDDAVEWLTVSLTDAQKEAIKKLGADSLGVLKVELKSIAWKLLSGNDNLPKPPTAGNFISPVATTGTLAIATQIAGESVVTLNMAKHIIGVMIAKGGTSTDTILQEISPVLGRLENLSKSSSHHDHSAFSLGKILLTVSGDADSTEPPTEPQSRDQAAIKLTNIFVTTNPTAEHFQAGLGVLVLLLGGIIDRTSGQP
jgi:hypothetical protein